jgi:hypothetical protein
MAIAHVQSAGNIVPDGGYYSSLDIYLSGDVGNVTASGTNYILVWIINADAGLSISDNLGNTYVEQTWDLWPGRCFVAKVTTGGDCTVTADFTSTNTYAHGYAMEFSGGEIAQPVQDCQSNDVTSMTSGGDAGDVPISSTLTGTLIVSMFYDDGTYGPGYWTGHSPGTGCANLRNVDAGWPNVSWITSAKASSFTDFIPTLVGISGADRQYGQWDLLLVRSIGVTLTLTETLSLADSLTKPVRSATLIKPNADTLTLTESLTKPKRGTTLINEHDDLSLADVFIPKPGQVKFYPAAETLGLADSVSFQQAKSVQVNDSLTIAEVLTKTIGATKLYPWPTDDLVIAESLTVRAYPIQRTLIETLAITDSVQFFWIVIPIQVADSLALTEQPLQKYWPPLLLPPFTETLTLTEQTPKFNWVRVVIQEALSLSDSAFPDFSRGLNTLYHFTALTGGTANCLDSIDGGSLIEGDRAFVIVGSAMSVYYIDEDYGGAESSPTVIVPDTNAENKRWRKATIG